MSIAWSTAATGARVVPILLIHGVPVVIVPEGVSITGITVSPAPAGWWPGTVYADFSAYLTPWLSLEGEGLTISERAIPTSAQSLEVSEVTLRLSDVDGDATALFSSEDLATATYITAEVSSTDTTVHVVSTTGFAASGVFYLDQEAIGYASKTGTTFTGCTRGLYGSVAARHIYSVAQGSGLGNPQATSLSVEVVGRPATLWLAQLNDAGAITALALEHYGTIGVGPALVGGGEDQTHAWQITVDHAIKRMAQVIRGTGVSVGGYAHPGNPDARTTLIAPSAVDLTPVWVVARNPSTGAITNLALLTGDSGTPDLGGWHPTRESYVNALSTALASALGSSSAQIVGDDLRISIGGLGATRDITAQTPCCAVQLNSTPSSVLRYTFTPGAMSRAWVPIFTRSPVYLTDSDYATVPPRPTLDADAAATNTSAYFALIFGDDDDRSSRKVAQIVDQVSSGGVNALLCTAITTERVRLIGFFNSASAAPPPRWRGGPYGNGFVISEPTTARLGLYVSSDTWVSALKYVCQSLDVEYASIYDAIDWDHMASIAAAYPSAIDQRREYLVDLNTTLLSMLQNEASLNGFALVMHEGRVSIARIAEFAVTETTSDSITTSDLDASAPVPTFEKGSDGIVNTYAVHAPDAGVTVQVIDRTSHARYGGQGTIVATMPRSLTGSAQDASRLYVQVFSQGVTVLGPLRYPYQHVGVRVPLNRYGLQIGDLVTATLWRVPNGRGGLGITDEIAQVIAREVTLYGEQHAGYVAYTLRLNPRNLQGYAPSALVASGGISGSDVTLDATTFGTGGFAGAGYTDGGAATFSTGDLVRLVEIDTTSPTASTQHTVTAVTGSVLTLSPAPSATFATLAASALKVMVIFDDWAAIVAGNRLMQQRFAYLADASDRLDASHAARVFAA